MNFIAGETSLVIAGAWNPAILSPQWVLQHCLNRPLDGTNRIQYLVPAGIGGMVVDFPRYGLDGFHYTVRNDAVIFVPEAFDEAHLNQIEDVATKGLELLGHTPITGIGHNFEFQDPAPTPELLNIFSNVQHDVIDALPQGWETKHSSIATAFQFNNVVMNIHRYFDGEKLGIKFNFHHAVENAAQSLRVLRGEAGYNRILANYDIAKALIVSIYGDVGNEA